MEDRFWEKTPFTVMEQIISVVSHNRTMGATKGRYCTNSSPPTHTQSFLNHYRARGRGELYTIMLLPSRNNLKVFMTYNSDLATPSPHFHSCRILGSKSLTNFGSIEETESEVRSFRKKTILESLQLLSMVLTTKLMAFKLLHYGGTRKRSTKINLCSALT